MEKHHRESIEKFLEIYLQDSTILAILLAGSIAHGYSKPDSDIDILLIVETDEFNKRRALDKLAFSLWDICTYENGYIDCKVVDLEYLNKVSQSGSDPARYAFKNNRVLYSRINNLQKILSDISTFPKEQINERRNRFASQLLAWKWFYGEGSKKKNMYLQILAIQKIVLFSSRIILNENELLYPFHKWMLEEVKKAENRPGGFVEQINDLLISHSVDKVNEFCRAVMDFINYDEKSVDWPNYFLHDSEQNWINHEPPVDDL